MTPFFCNTSSLFERKTKRKTLLSWCFQEGSACHKPIRYCIAIYSHSMALFLSSRHSSCTQFSVPSRDECRQVTPCRVSSASGTKAGTTPKTFFKLKGIEFLFLSQRARRTAFGGSISPKTPVLKLNRPLACKPPASTASESALVVFEPFAKPQVTGLWYRWAK